MGRMGNAKDGRIVGLALLAFVAVGCQRHVEIPYEEFVKPAPAYSPPSAGNNAFDVYVSAATDVEARASQSLNRVRFEPSDKARLLKLCSGALSRMSGAMSMPCEFRFEPTPPFQTPKYHAGWRLLGRTMVWQIQEAALRNDVDTSISAALLATKFGFDLTGGGAMDASLGLVIVDEAREALMPLAPRMQTSQKLRLAEGLKRILEGMPPLAGLADNEEANLMASVQAVQDAYRDKRLDGLTELLGSSVKPGIEHLKKIDDAAERAEYFRGLAQEAREECRWIREIAQLPTSKRKAKPEIPEASFRPWWRISQAMFPTLRPLFGVKGSFRKVSGFGLGLYDSTLARTRLLALQLLLERKVLLEKKSAPPNLDGFPDVLTTDPLSGQPFVYRADGPDFVLYSVGGDLRDDGGLTDEAGTQPDLRVQRP